MRKCQIVVLKVTLGSTWIANCCVLSSQWRMCWRELLGLNPSWTSMVFVCFFSRERTCIITWDLLKASCCSQALSCWLWKQQGFSVFLWYFLRNCSVCSLSVTTNRNVHSETCFLPAAHRLYPDLGNRTPQGFLHVSADYATQALKCCPFSILLVCLQLVAARLNWGQLL